jgi:5-methylcytosine-specific restriction endonuclease McrBC regulatory subunit McrC
MEKENDIDVLIKLRSQRDLIFDAKYKGLWVTSNVNIVLKILDT